MFIERETNTIHIRMGNSYKYISSIILNDGTRLVNMQCVLREPRPSNEELQAFEDKVKDTFKTNYKKDLEYLNK